MYELAGLGATVTPLAAEPADVMPSIKQIHAPSLWRTTRGEGVVVGIVDSGIEKTHPYLAASILDGRSFVPGSPDWSDENGHGTAVAGVVRQVAPGVKFVIARAFDRYGRAEDGATVAALDWLRAWRGPAGERVHIINCSWGGPHNPLLELVIQQLVEAAGILVGAAAGNERHQIGGPSNVAYPARYPWPVAVAATMQILRGVSVPAEFSSGGPEIDLTGPGTWIYAPALGGGWATWSGTSFSCPHAVGMAALWNARWYKQCGRWPTEPEGFSMLRAGARPLPDVPFVLQGWGELDASPLTIRRRVEIPVDRQPPVVVVDGRAHQVDAGAVIEDGRARTPTRHTHETGFGHRSTGTTGTRRTERSSFKARSLSCSTLKAGHQQATRGANHLMRVYLDPGHGGPDRGGRALPGLDEADLNLAIALAAAEHLRAAGVDVRMSRADDNIKQGSQEELKRRTTEANGWGADCFVSVHNNSMGGSGAATGVETYVQQGNAPSQDLGMRIHSAVLKVMGRPDRGVRTRDLDDGRIHKLGAGTDPDTDEDYYHVLRKANMPSVIIEGGFMDHPADGARLKDSEVLRQLGVAIAGAVIDWGRAQGLLKVRPDGAPARVRIWNAAGDEIVAEVPAVLVPGGNTYVDLDEWLARVGAAAQPAWGVESHWLHVRAAAALTWRTGWPTFSFTSAAGGVPATIDIRPGA